MKLVLTLAAAIASLSALLVSAAPAARAQDAGSAPPSGEMAKPQPKKAAAKSRKKAAAKAKKKAPESRYKSTALSQSLEEHYRFDEDGNPIDKKKPAVKAKKKAPSADEDDDKAACSADDACSDPKTDSDADAL